MEIQKSSSICIIAVTKPWHYHLKEIYSSYVFGLAEREKVRFYFLFSALLVLYLISKS